MNRVCNNSHQHLLLDNPSDSFGSILSTLMDLLGSCCRTYTILLALLTSPLLLCMLLLLSLCTSFSCHSSTLLLPSVAL
eukprot:3313994-Karenia_brevis.AAC.1